MMNRAAAGWMRLLVFNGQSTGGLTRVLDRQGRVATPQAMAKRAGEGSRAKNDSDADQRGPDPWDEADEDEDDRSGDQHQKAQQCPHLGGPADQDRARDPGRSDGVAEDDEERQEQDN